MNNFFSAWYIGCDCRRKRSFTRWLFNPVLTSRTIDLSFNIINCYSISYMHFKNCFRNVLKVSWMCIVWAFFLSLWTQCLDFYFSNWICTENHYWVIDDKLFIALSCILYYFWFVTKFYFRFLVKILIMILRYERYVYTTKSRVKTAHDV